MASKFQKHATLKIRPDADRQRVYQWIKALNEQDIANADVTELTLAVEVEEDEE